MRWVVISLLIMNLGCFGYLMTQPTSEVPELELVNATQTAGAGGIQLLSESNQPKVKKKVPTKKQGGEDVCWIVGPFRDTQLAQNLNERMKAMSLNARLETKPIVIKTEIWVYIPPMASQKQAMLKLKELQRRKIDSFVITEGELENGISLGLFSKKESVERLMARLKQRKIDAEMKEIERTRDQHWVIAPIQSGFVLDQSARDRLSDGKVMNWQQLRCDSALPGA